MALPHSPSRSDASDERRALHMGAHEVPANVLHEFTFDCELGETYERQSTRCGLAGLTLALLPAGVPFVPPLMCVYDCICGNKNRADDWRTRRLYVTREAIVSVSGGVLTSCRCECTRNARVTKTIPIDRIQDITVALPAGGCCVREVLTGVRVETAGASGGGPEVNLAGLREPARFRELVLAIKFGRPLPEWVDAQAAASYAAHAPAAAASAAPAMSSDGLSGVLPVVGGGGPGAAALASALHEVSATQRELLGAVRKLTEVMEKRA